MTTLSISSKVNGFDNVFLEVVPSKTLHLKNKNCLRLFHFDISNNEFSYDGLQEVLQRNIGRYVFSRATIDQFYADDNVDAISLKAVDLLRSASNHKDKGAGGELGEILLYLFLEIKLNAPKLLSKVELKSTTNQYVYGSDGVHLLSLGDKDFQVVLGESKIKGKLNNAVDEAFVSIQTVAEKPDNEIRLIERNILSEKFDEDTAKFIKSLIVPSKRDTSVSVDKAFGIFLGYTLDVDPTQYSNDEFRKVVNNKLKNDLDKIAIYIERKINDSKLAGYSFYFFVLPFNNAARDRASIIKKLKGEC